MGKNRKWKVGKGFRGSEVQGLKVKKTQNGKLGTLNCEL
jgi:ribosomal protein L13E